MFWRMWWIRFLAMLSSVYGPSSGLAVVCKTLWLCDLLPSHTLWQELVKKNLYNRIIFPCVRNYYLTCSDNPLVKKHKRMVDNQTGEHWSSLFLVLRWVVYYTCYIPVNVISFCSTITHMCPHEYSNHLLNHSPQYLSLGNQDHMMREN